MPTWLMVLYVACGAVGVKLIELIGRQLQFWNIQGTGIRGELWKEIRAQRTAIANLQTQVNELREKISELRIARHAAANLANWFGVRLRLAMVEVNERDEELKRPPTYDLAAMDAQIRQEKADAEAMAVAQVKGAQGK